MRSLSLVCLLALTCSCSSPPPAKAGEPTTVFLLGRFGAPYSRENLTRTLCDRGFEVAQRFGDDVQLVVLGNGPINEAGDGFTPIAELPEYVLATQRGVPVVTFMDFLAANDIPSAMPR
ncbi:MAG: hypothetical protein H6835_02810 [Planctomycetes bacterium]|nr:hypothetical protein [Planctomycetota bacterium]